MKHPNIAIQGIKVDPGAPPKGNLIFTDGADKDGTPGTEALRFEPGGKAFVRGVETTDRKLIVNAYRDWLVRALDAYGPTTLFDKPLELSEPIDPQAPGRVSFSVAHDETVLEFLPNGDVIVLGELVESDDKLRGNTRTLLHRSSQFGYWNKP